MHYFHNICGKEIGNAASPQNFVGVHMYLCAFRNTSNRSKHLMVDGCLSEQVNVVSRVQQGSIFYPLLFLLCTSELF